MIFRAAVAAVSVVLALTACGGGEPSAACQAAPKPVLDEIATRGDGISDMKSGQAYKSPDFENVWFIAGTFSAEGVDDQTGVWAVNGLDGSGSVLSIDGTAQQFTTWPHGDTSSTKIDSSDPGVKAVKSC